ncbi:CRIB domain-containing protein RIC7 [Linum grandiflorum]
MGTGKIKGIYKGFKYIIQIFVVKEKELEIGCPTDVKHVAHIGWDGATESPPSWMDGFKTSPEVVSSVKACAGFANNNNGMPKESNNSVFSTPWSSQGIQNSMKYHHLPGSCTLDDDIRSCNPPSKPKKQKRKKKTRSSPSKSSSASSSLSKNIRSSSNTKSGFHDLEQTMAILA